MVLEDVVQSYLCRFRTGFGPQIVASELTLEFQRTAVGGDFCQKSGYFRVSARAARPVSADAFLFLIRFVPFMWLKLLWDFRGVRILSAGSDQSAAAVGVFTAIFCHFSTQNRSHKGIMVNYAVCYDHSSMLSHLEQPGAVLSPPE